MKRISTAIASILLALVPLAAQEHLSERVYLSTDKEVYVAGDDMFLSAFCIDKAGARLSGTSATAYVELISAEGPVQTAKLALTEGRGAGVLTILNAVPTGCYKLVAYTSQCFNEDGYDFEEGARDVVIINPFTSERSSSGVEIVEDEEYFASAPTQTVQGTGDIEVSAADGEITITNRSSKAVSLSVSLYNDDGIAAPQHSGIAAFIENATVGKSFTPRRVIDYEGEVIRTKVRGVSADSLASLKGSYAYLSVPGRMSDVYLSRLDGSGNATFYTRNIYGKTDAFLEIDSKGGVAHLDVESPFKGVKASGLEPLRLCSGLEPLVSRRSVAMQVARASQADTLYEYLEIPEDRIFSGDANEYILDDYTRFPLMEELFIEFIHEVKARKAESGRVLTILLNDSFKPSQFSQLQSLALLDGVPVLDQNRIFDYDPLLVERILVYPHTYNFGEWYFAGVVNFITYKHTLPSYEFDESVRVVDFQGESYPVAAYMPSAESSLPDLRQTVLWHPLVEIAPGQKRTLHYTLPSYEGDFKLVVEGVDEGLAPQYNSIPVE